RRKPARAAAREQAVEQILEAVAARAPRARARACKASKAGAGLEGRALIAVRIDLAAVEPRALLLVGQKVERGRDALEALRRRLVVRTHVRVQLLCELSVGSANVLGARRFRHAQRGIRIPAQACPSLSSHGLSVGHPT